MDRDAISRSGTWRQIRCPFLLLLVANLPCPPEKNIFRLTLQGRERRSSLFEANRNGFRSALASALIDLRRDDRVSPLVLEIGVAAVQAGAKVQAMTWLSLPQRQYPGGALPVLIRWECAVDIYECLSRQRAEVLAERYPQNKGEVVYDTPGYSF